MTPGMFPEANEDLAARPLLRGIINLKATLVFTSAARTPDGARIGNLALTSSIVGKILGLMDPEDQQKAVPELYAWLTNSPGYAAGIDVLNQPLAAFFDNPVKDISAAIGRVVGLSCGPRT